MLVHMDASSPQEMTWRLWIPPSEIVSAIASALQRKTLTRDSLLVEPPPLMVTGQSGSSSIEMLSLTPYSYNTGIQCLSSINLRGSTGQEPFPPADFKYNPAWLRTPYV